jgi:hypothetical protein
METIRITKMFYFDHVERDLPAPPIVKETKSHIWIDATSTHLNELWSDASFYADSHSFDVEFGSSLAALVRSAKATEKAITSYIKVAA